MSESQINANDLRATKWRIFGTLLGMTGMLTAMPLFWSQGHMVLAVTCGLVLLGFIIVLGLHIRNLVRIKKYEDEE